MCQQWTRRGVQRPGRQPLSCIAIAPSRCAAVTRYSVLPVINDLCIMAVVPPQRGPSVFAVQHSVNSIVDNGARLRKRDIVSHRFSNGRRLPLSTAKNTTAPAQPPAAPAHPVMQRTFGAVVPSYKAPSIYQRTDVNAHQAARFALKLKRWCSTTSSTNDQ